MVNAILRPYQDTVSARETFGMCWASGTEARGRGIPRQCDTLEK
jgi:hypothetical protein